MFFIPQKISYFLNKKGEAPFIDWFESLDHSAEQIVRPRLERVKSGNFGDYKNLGEGLFELRIHSGVGFRIYFAR